MNFSVILIVKNEEHNLDHLHDDLANFMNDGGEVIIVDTGSSDSTIEKAQRLGFRIEKAEEELTKIISEEDMEKIRSYLKDNLENISFNFFDFAKARNYAHTFAKNDMILQLDASHHLINFDYKSINDKINNNAYFFEYEALWFKNENSEGITNMQERFYNRKYFSWTNYVHECIISQKNMKKHKLEPSELLIHHIAGNKVRNYLSGLFAYYLIHPEDARNISYLARELFFMECYRTTIYFLEIYHTFSHVWINEKSNAYVMMGNSYENLNEYNKAISCYKEAHEICKIWREPLIALAKLYLNNKQYYDAIIQCKRALIIENTNAYMENYANYTYLPHQLIAAACKNLKNDKYVKLGKFHVQKCIELNENLKYMENFFLSSSAKEENMKTVAIYLSYCSLQRNKGGSEIAAENLALSLSKKGYKVFLLSIDEETRCIDDVTYMNYDTFQSLELELDILILSRYINYYIDFDFKPKKTYLWFHDTMLCNYYRGLKLNNKGSYLFKHIQDKLDGVIVLTDWHKEKIVSEYPFVKNINVINYGIQNHIVEENLIEKKVKNRFIYTSSFNRGVIKLVEYFHQIFKQLPDAELHIFRDFTGYEEYVEEWKQYPYIKVYGNVDNKRIIEEFTISSVWFYPTDWEETFCLSALEAQLTKCLCICSDLAALKNVVGDRGILFDKDMSKDECVQLVVNTLKDEEKVKKLTEKAHDWALQQNWDTKVNEWLELFFRE
jgi:glycosyltransferase involved in cell wall biosynthesis